MKCQRNQAIRRKVEVHAKRLINRFMNNLAIIGVLLASSGLVILSEQEIPCGCLLPTVSNISARPGTPSGHCSRPRHDSSGGGNDRKRLRGFGSAIQRPRERAIGAIAGPCQRALAWQEKVLLP